MVLPTPFYGGSRDSRREACNAHCPMGALPLLRAAKALCECAAAVVKRRGLPAGTLVGYEEIAEESFGKLGRAVISAIIYTELFGTCALLFILEVRGGIKHATPRLCCLHGLHGWHAPVLRMRCRAMQAAIHHRGHRLHPSCHLPSQLLFI